MIDFDQEPRAIAEQIMRMSPAGAGLADGIRASMTKLDAVRSELAAMANAADLWNACSTGAVRHGSVDCVLLDGHAPPHLSRGA